MKKCISTLIVARPGRMRDSLWVLLKAIPGIDIIDQVDDGPSALRMLMDHRPALVLLASNLPGDQFWGVLRQTRARQPQTRCLVLADSSRQQRLAETAGADSVLLAGFPAAKFFATVERLLPQQEARP